MFGTWLLMGCSNDAGSDEAEASSEPTPPVEELYETALASFSEGDYEQAVDDFERVEQEYPFSDWAKRAQVMAAYSAYRDESFAEAALILDRFVKLHPNNESTPYAYYLRALTYYDQIVDVGRDQQTTEQARQALRDVVSRFPETEYARDAKIKLELTEDHLAGKEMEIGRYYLQREEFLASVNRFIYVIENYQTTSHVPEALHRLVEAYLQLGVMPEAHKYAAVLGHNFPGSKWYQYSYAMLNGEIDPKAAEEGKAWYDGLVP